MLENSKNLFGEDAKAFNQACKDYTDANTIIKDTTVTKNNASNLIKKLCSEIGTTYESNSWVITMSETGERETCDLKAIKELAPDMYLKLKKMGFIKVSESVLKMGTPKPKTKI